MKKSLLVLFVLVFLTCLSCNKKTDNAKEEVVIKAAIEGEINASFNGDYNLWTGFFVHEPYLVWMQSWKDGYTCLKGWQDISTFAQKWIKPERKGTIIFNGNSDYSIRIYDNAAFVSFKCKITGITDGQKKESESMEVRFLENHGGNWKIAYLSSIYMFTYK